MSVFAQYLRERPEIIYHKKQLMGVLKDALCNDMPSFRVLQAAVEVGVVETLKEKGELAPPEEARYIVAIQEQYAMKEKAAKYAVEFWVQHITPDLLKRAAEAEENWDNSYQNQIFQNYQQEREQVSQRSAEKGQRLSIRQDFRKQAIVIRWKRDPKASAYEIWRAEGNGEFQQIEKKSFALPTFTDVQIQAGKTYSYALCMEQNKKLLSEFSNVLQITAPLKPPTFQIQQVELDGNEIRLRWGFQVRVERYTVFRKAERNSSWEILAETEGAKCSFSDRAEFGQRLFYKVQCLKQDGSIQTSEMIEVNT